MNFYANVIKLVKFGHLATGNAAYLEFNLTTFLQESDVISAVNAVKYLGEFTNTTGGLAVAYAMLANPVYGSRGGNVPKVIVLITDGAPNLGVDALPGIVTQIKGTGIRLVTVGVTDKVGPG